MRILITGGHGQLGRALQTTLTPDHEVVALDLPAFDITDRAAVEAALVDQEPDVVIHAAALTDVDGCARDPALALRVNGLGTQNVALACAARGADLLHISTNEVFDGTQPAGYAEWAPLSPANPYGASKAAAEHHVRHLLPNHYIVRTAWLYAPGGRNFVHAILNRARSSGRLRVVTDEVGNPTATTDLAAALARLITTGQYGTYHLVNAGVCSRYAFAREICRLAGLAEVPIEPIFSKEFRRASTPPRFGALNNNNAAALGLTLRSWQEALAAYIATYESENV
jgi:dTDP-4-dehydrorhamnose reductase